MYQHCESATIDEQELDRLIAEAMAADEARSSTPHLIAIDDDLEVESSVQGSWITSLIQAETITGATSAGLTSLEAVKASALVVGTIYEASSRPTKGSRDRLRRMHRRHRVCRRRRSPSWVADRYARLLS